MKKLICILLCLCVLFPLASCKRDQNEEKECYLSSASVIWGSRIYRIQKAKNITGNNQTYLVYSKVGENGKDIRIGCVDPLCTHDRNTCTAHCAGGEELLFVPEEKAPKIYFFYRTVSQTTDMPIWSLICMDMKNGTRMTVCELSEDFRISQTKLLFSDSYIYWTGTVQDGTGGAIYDQVWRVSADGGEAEQLSALGNEAENASYSLYYRDSEGYFYYYTSYYTSEHTQKQYFARSKDFADEKILLDDTDEDTISVGDIHVSEGMIYYFKEKSSVSGTEERPLSKEYDVYEDELYDCTLYSIYRIPTDGSAEPQLIADDALHYQKLSITVTDGKLYYIPLDTRLIGTLEYVTDSYITGIPEEDMKKGEKKILRYIRSYNSGKVTEVDLRTLQTKTYTLGPKAEISALFGVFGDQLVVGTKTTDLDRVSQIGKGGFESYDIDTGAGFFFDNPYCEYGTVTTK